MQEGCNFKPSRGCRGPSWESREQEGVRSPQQEPRLPPAGSGKRLPLSSGAELLGQQGVIRGERLLEKVPLLNNNNDNKTRKAHSALLPCWGVTGCEPCWVLGVSPLGAPLH